MKIIKDLPKQPAYKCYLDTKTNCIKTGYVGYFSNEKEIPVPVVELELELDFVARGRSSVTFNFKEVGTDNIYQAGPKACLELFKMSNFGKLSGLFTFRKQGDSVYLWPYEE